MRDNKFRILIYAGIGLALVLGIILSPFASSSPDGLEKVAEDHGFLAAAEETPPLWDSSPVPDYEMPGVRNSSLAVSLAGLAGVIITLLIAYGAGKLISLSGRKSKQVPGQQ